MCPENAYFVRTAKALTDDNAYPATIAVLSAAVIKLGKIERATLVYRAPGGALPTSFWRQNADGVTGGLEAAFMSTTTAQAEALHYASRAKAKVLFEIRQGLVARGAYALARTQSQAARSSLLRRRLLPRATAVR